MKVVLFICLVCVFFFSDADSKEVKDKPELANVPPLGWNSFAALGCSINEAIVFETIDSIFSILSPINYDFYIILADCIFPRGSRDPSTGVLIADPKRFPVGISEIILYAHQKGLKVAIGTDVGQITCAGYEGSYGHEKLDAETFALWGIDYVFETCCGINEKREELFTKMSQYLSIAGRPMAFHIMAPGLSAWKWAPHISHVWYIGSLPFSPLSAGGISWNDVLRNLDEDSSHSVIAGPNGYNDAGFLGIGHTKLTENEMKTQFSLWSILASPLILAFDIRNASLTLLNIIENSEVISINQDKLGSQGLFVWDNGNGGQAWAKKLSVNRKTDRSIAVALINRGGSISTITVTWDELGLINSSPTSVRDLWTHSDLGTYQNSISVSLPPHSTTLYKLTQSLC